MLKSRLIDGIMYIVSGPIALLFVIYFCSFIMLGPISIPLMVGEKLGWEALGITFVVMNGLGWGSFLLINLLESVNVGIDRYQDTSMIIWIVIFSILATFITMEPELSNQLIESIVK